MPTANEVLRQGWQLHQAGKIELAERVYRGVLAQLPDHPESLVYLGIALFDSRRFEESVDAYRRALRQRDNFPVAWNNLGNSLRMLGRTDEAEACFEKALAQRPGYLSTLKNRGTLWVWTGEIERGLRWYREGLRVDPDNAELHRNLGVISLLLGRYDEGWAEYRWRWRMPGLGRPAVSAPVWQGEDLDGRSILLYPEQGRGDAIQFVRVASLLRDQGAKIILQSASAMIPLFSSAPGIDLLVPAGTRLPPVDFQASLIDVVDVWYTRYGELPPSGDLFARGGYLAASESLRGYWGRWLDRNASAPRIGINWQGNPEHHADVYRSLPLSALEPLARRPEAELVSLQFGPGVEQLETCGFGDAIVRLPQNLDTTGGAFVDTAAILQNLDLVITSDTALAHLAGALGVDVIVMLGKVPDWRWLLEGETTAWYPSMRLVRQTEMGRWDDVVEQVRRELAKRPFCRGGR